MSHVDDGQLNALLDGELTAAEARAVEAHVASCRDCARRLSEARAFLAEAGELLAVLTPPQAEPVAPLAAAAPPLVAPVAAGPAAANPPRPGEAPRVAQTAKEVAISVDGRTELTPAIRPVFAHEVPPPRRKWPLPDLEKLAWAASIILAVGVGYLANEVYHQRRVAELATSEGAVRPATDAAPAEAQQQAPARTDAPPPAAPAARRSVPPASGAGPASSTGVAGFSSGRAAANEEPKPPRISKPAPDFARQQPEQLAASADENRRNEIAPAPATAAARDDSARALREQAPANPGALGDVAASAVPPSQGAGLRQRSPAAAPAPAATAPAERDALARNYRPAGFRTVPMEEAVRSLSGSIRLIDGMNPARIEVGPGQAVPGADSARDVVRVTYAGGLVLDQQMGDADAASFNGLMPGDTLVTTSEAGTTQVRWLDRKFWLSLTGRAPADSLRALVERVR